MQNMNIAELDRITALGLKHLEALITAPNTIKEGNMQDERHDKAVQLAATTTLNVFAQSTRRISAISNRAAVSLKVAVAAGLEGDALLPIWNAIAPPKQIGASSRKKK